MYLHDYSCEFPIILHIFQLQYWQVEIFFSPTFTLECLAHFISHWLILSKLSTNAFFNATSNKLGVGTKFIIVWWGGLDKELHLFYWPFSLTQRIWGFKYNS
jgi:hypothetical protein